MTDPVNREALARLIQTATDVFHGIVPQDRDSSSMLSALGQSLDALSRPEAVGASEPVAEVERLTALLNTPEVEDFAKGVVSEAQHQRFRHGAEHDAGKGPFDWFWLVGYLAQKAADAAVRGDAEKAKHHTISTAAALANWHAHLNGDSTVMRPGIDAIERGFAPPPPTEASPADKSGEALTWLAAHKNCELSFDYGNADDDGKGWCVHRVNGGVNDREWTLIGSGPTPEVAIRAAAGQPVKMRVDQEWLSRHVATDPDTDVEVSPPIPSSTAGEGEVEGLRRFRDFVLRQCAPSRHGTLSQEELAGIIFNYPLSAPHDGGALVESLTVEERESLEFLRVGMSKFEGRNGNIRIDTATELPLILKGLATPAQVSGGE